MFCLDVLPVPTFLKSLVAARREKPASRGGLFAWYQFQFPICSLKDVETVESDPERVKKWVTFTREIIDEVFG